jgi:hypothetical protein
MRVTDRGAAMKSGRLIGCVALLALLLAAVAQGSSPPAQAASTCSDYPNQAAAQRAADTLDPDHDGIYCESLPCPCLKPGGVQEPPASRPSCVRPSKVAKVTFSKTRYRNIRRHYLRAVRKGWPTVLVLNRPGADARRDRLLQRVPTRSGYDRDEFPPAIGRGRGRGLTRGTHPTGWKASVAYVPSHENRSHGSALGTKLRRYCNGTRFRYVFY